MLQSKPKIIRITTIPQSMRTLLKGQLRYMEENGFEIIGVSSPGKALNDVIENEGIKTIPIKMARVVSPLQDIKSIYQLYRLFKKEKPQIVHTHTPKAGLVGMIAAKLAGVPHRLHTVAGMPLLVITGFKRTILDIMEKLTYAYATKVYPNSVGLYDIILENKFTSQDKLKVLGNGSSNGIDTEFFSPKQVSDASKDQLRSEIGFQPDDFVFVFVGRLVGDKGINELVEAFQKLDKENIKLLLVGSKEENLFPIKKQTSDAIESNPNIIWAGHQKDVRPYFAISNALVFPSYREGFPNVVMQAGAMELPAIVSNINGCNEIIVEGQNGTITEPQQFEGLYEKMKEFYSNKELFNSLKQNSRKMIVDRYERKYVWEALKKEYNQLKNK